MEQNYHFTETNTWPSQVLMPSFAQDWPLLPAVKAEGAYLYTADGKRYLDFTSGIAVTNVGHGNPRVLAAAREQMEKFSHSAVGITLHEPLLQLCQALPQVMPAGMEMFYFGNSGAEAVEGALKLARYVTGRPGIIAFEGGFHGRTYGAASVTSVKAKYRDHYEPFVPGVYFAPYAYPYRCPWGADEESVINWCMDGLQRIFDRLIPPRQVAAMLVEPVQGEGGYVVPPAGFLHALRQVCDEHGILLILDEVQTGFGRTGEMFAAQAFGVQPDIMAIAKGIANGFPLSATVASRELMGRWLPGAHGTTYGGNPIACAAALAVLEVIREENLLENCRLMGARLMEGFRRLQGVYPQIGEVRGLGLMVAMELIHPGTDKAPDGSTAFKVLNQALERGLLGYMAGLHGQVIRLIPPLNVTAEQVDEALRIIDESLAAL
ncbi:MAG TPA: aspartate aminotransferase family protein [Anaerolineales bacterium]|nr:aspartate aminotransferase family protein [Anaerolineales bacterium]